MSSEENSCDSADLDSSEDEESLSLLRELDLEALLPFLFEPSLLPSLLKFTKDPGKLMCLFIYISRSIYDSSNV